MFSMGYLAYQVIIISIYFPYKYPSVYIAIIYLNGNIFKIKACIQIQFIIYKYIQLW